MSLSTLLVLADGRLPSGAHAHSGGIEAAVAAGRVHDLRTLESFLLGRTATTGVMSAAFAAATCHALTTDGVVSAAVATDHALSARPDEEHWDRVRALDDGLDARTASPALRAASRAQGRALLRAVARIWPDVAQAGERPAARSRFPAGSHHPTAIGIAAAAAGLGPAEAGLVAVYGGLTGAASAAVRLLGLDPYAVHGLVAALAQECDRVAADAALRVDDPVDDLPAGSALLLDIDAEQHATWEVRLFAS
ncbi:MAG TPA: urease accessory UreF family protein [Asanoa sp.]|jgi:urease accessory protein|nr:urease accessory UreF family protein [Asanoa sp.]